MVIRRIHAPSRVQLDLDAIRAELDVPGPFPAAALAEAERPQQTDLPRRDRTDLPFVTVDPPGSRDLDQAVALETTADGWRVHYAIADVGAWVRPGGALDAEARRRTQTYYAPDHHQPLHPPALGEGAASLLPDGARPAVLWTIDVDGAGDTTRVEVERAVVRSRAQLTYEGVQAAVDAGPEGDLPEPLRALPALGDALLAAARRRGAIELGLPEQDVVAGPDGTWTLVLRPDLAVERWNAQISLLTGRAAASIMLGGGTGILRTVPVADERSVARLRRAAGSLGIDWPDGRGPGEVLASLDLGRPAHAAFAELAAELLRGAAYVAFDGVAPDSPGHAGVGAPYAHVTAPLRRLVDRFGTEVCLALAAGGEVPSWAREALPSLPDAMAEGDRRARALDRAAVDATEALVLADRVGDEFDAHVVDVDGDDGTVVLDDPPVRARCDGDGQPLPLGRTIRVRCTEADVSARRVRFRRVP